MTMTASNGDSPRRLKRRSLAGIAFGALALPACELPIFLTLIGFGTLAAIAQSLRPPFWLEIVGVRAAAAGFAGLIWHLVQRRVG